MNSYSTVLIIQIDRHVPIHEFSYNLTVILQQLYQPFEQIQDYNSRLKRIRRKNEKQEINKKYYNKKILKQKIKIKINSFFNKSQENFFKNHNFMSSLLPSKTIDRRREGCSWLSH